jgi:uncharacterized protein involved in exopolysaccharide biosynthesis
MATTELQTMLPQPVEQDTGPGLSEYLGIFKRRLKLILIPFILCLLLSAVVAYVVPAQFTQHTKFKIYDPSLTKSLVAGLQATVTHKPLLRTMDSDIKSRRFLAPIVAKVVLNEGFNLNNPLEETDFYAYVFKHLVIQVPDVRSRSSVGPDLVTMTYTGRSQARNVEFLNEIRDQYKEYFRSEYRETIRGIHDQQRDRIRDLRNRLAQMDVAYESFRNGPDYRLVGIKKGHLMQLANMRDNESVLRLEIKGLEAQLIKIKIQLRDQSKTSSILNKIQNPRLLAMRGQLSQAMLLLNKMVDVDTGFGWSDKVEAVQKQKALLAKLELTISSIPEYVDGGTQLQVNQVYIQLQNDRNDLQRQLDGSRDILGQVTRRIETVQGELAKENDLTQTDLKFLNDISILKNTEHQTSGKFSRIESEWKRIQGEGSDLFVIIDLPNPNTKPVFPSVPLFLAIGAALGALIGLGLAFLKEFSSLTYLTPAQVQSRLPVPILGEVSEIKTEEEHQAERAKKRRNRIAGGIVVVIFAFVHYCYFEASMTHLLPPIVVDVLDMLYKGS